MASVNSSILGVNLSQVVAGSASVLGVGASHALGTRVSGTDGTEYLLVQAAAAISTTTSQPYCITVDENFEAVKCTKATLSAGHMVAFAPQLILADDAIFWAITKGANFNIRVAASCAADVNLWSTATAGVLDDTSGATHVAVLGVKLVVAASASTSALNTVREAIVTNTLVPLLIA